MPERRTLTEAERQASGWIVRMKAHDATAGDRRDFEAWLQAHPDNRKAYAKLERTWAIVQSLQHLKGHVPANDTEPSRANWLRPTLAAAAAALLAIGALYWFTRSPAPEGEHYVSAPADIRTLTLSDGSSVTLSGASNASIAISETERRVDLQSGYALFDVTHDENRPFVVHTPQGDIRVLGTSFVVRVADSEVRTTVLRGSVSGAAQRDGLFARRSEAVTARANQEIVLRKGEAELVAISTEAVPRRLAWRDNMLAFDGETLNEAIAQVSQQTGWRFELEDPSLGDMRVGGYVHADPEAFIELLNTSLNLETRPDGDRRIIISRRS